MRIALGPVGAPADVFAMFGLGKVLQERGHHVIFCAPEEYRARAYQLGFQMVSCGSSYQKYLEAESDTGNASTELVRTLEQDIAMHFVSQRDALREADIMVGSMLQVAGPSVSEQFGVAYMYALTSPFLLGEKSYADLGVRIDQMSGIFASRNKGKRVKTWDEYVLHALNRERRFSGLPNISDLNQYLIHSGPLLIAVDADFVSTGTNGTITGFWNFDPVEAPETEAPSGSPLVYLDRFQTPGSDQLVFLKEVSDQLSRSGIQSVIMSGSAISQNVSVIVHAGNSDTVARAMHFGIPQIIVPTTIAQYDWAQRIQKLELATAPLLKPLPAEVVSAIHRTLNDSSLQERARSYAEKPRSQDGLTIAAETIEKTLASK
jgi:UDP:flavonoid glycosyltransferase YjiC (YdhE family)